jgi:hypothetical protein
MVTTLKDDAGKVIALCEWRLVGQSGQEVPSGEYIWVNDCWVHEEFRMKHRINRIIDEIMRTVPTAKYCYFQRKDVSRKVHLYSRSQWERRRNSYDNLIKGESDGR